jgi:hypothetical protein
MELVTRSLLPPTSEKNPAPDRLLGVKKLAENLQDVKTKMCQRLGLETRAPNFEEKAKDEREKVCASISSECH